MPRSSDRNTEKGVEAHLRAIATKWVDKFVGRSTGVNSREYAEIFRQYLSQQIVERIPRVVPLLANLERTSKGKQGIHAEDVLEAIACPNVHAAVFPTIAARMVLKQVRLRGRDLAAFESLGARIIDVPGVPQNVRDAWLIVRKFVRGERDVVDRAKLVRPHEQRLAPWWDLNRKKRHVLIQDPPLRVARLLIAHGLSTREACQVTAHLLIAWDAERFSHGPKKSWSADDVRRRLERPTKPVTTTPMSRPKQK